MVLEGCKSALDCSSVTPGINQQHERSNKPFLVVVLGTGLGRLCSSRHRLLEFWQVCPWSLQEGLLCALGIDVKECGVPMCLSNFLCHVTSCQVADKLSYLVMVLFS